MNLKVWRNERPLEAEFEAAWRERLARATHAGFVFDLGWLAARGARGEAALAVLADQGSRAGALVLRARGRELWCGTPSRVHAVCEGASGGSAFGLAPDEADWMFRVADRVAGRRKLRAFLPGEPPEGPWLAADAVATFDLAHAEEELELVHGARLAERLGSRGVHVTAVEATAAADALSGATPALDPWSAGDPLARAIVATHEGVVVGALGASVRAGGTADLRALAVASTAGAEVPAALVLELVRLAREAGCRWLVADPGVAPGLEGGDVELRCRLGGKGWSLANRLETAAARLFGRRRAATRSVAPAASIVIATPALAAATPVAATPEVVPAIAATGVEEASPAPAIATTGGEEARPAPAIATTGDEEASLAPESFAPVADSAVPPPAVAAPPDESPEPASGLETAHAAPPAGDSVPVLAVTGDAGTPGESRRRRGKGKRRRARERAQEVTAIASPEVAAHAPAPLVVAPVNEAVIEAGTPRDEAPSPARVESADLHVVEDVPEAAVIEADVVSTEPEVALETPDERLEPAEPATASAPPAGSSPGPDEAAPVTSPDAPARRRARRPRRPPAGVLAAWSTTEELEPEFEREWNATLARCSRAHFAFDLAQLEVEARLGLHARLGLVERDGRRGLFVLRARHGQWVCGWPWRWQATVEDGAGDPTIELDVDEALWLWGGMQALAGGGRVRAYLPSAHPASVAGFEAGATLVQTLDHDDDALLAAMSDDVRARARAARDAGWTVELAAGETAFRRFRALQREAEARRGVESPPDPEPAEPGEAWREWELPWMWLLVARREETIEAGLGDGAHPGGVLEARVGAATREAMAAGVLPLLSWEELRRARDHGHRWINHGGDTPFKRAVAGSAGRRIALHCWLGGGATHRLANESEAWAHRLRPQMAEWARSLTTRRGAPS